MAVESGLRQRVVQLLRSNGYFVQAIESETTPGLPDVYYRKDVAGWLELKHIKVMPLRPTTSIFKSYNHPLLTEQINWIDLERRHGGRADILVGYKAEYFFVPGCLAAQFNNFTEPDLRRFVINKNDIVRKLV